MSKESELYQHTRLREQGIIAGDEERLWEEMKEEIEQREIRKDVLFEEMYGYPRKMSLQIVRNKIGSEPYQLSHQKRLQIIEELEKENYEIP